jgi:hypothetical protein
MKKKYLALPFFVLVLIFGLVRLTAAAPIRYQVVLDGTLPSFTYLGQGPGTYTIESDRLFLVKTYQDGRFVFVQADPPTVELSRNSERVWSVDFLPAENIRYFDESVNYGQVAAGCVINYVQIEDNIDERRNHFYLNGNLIHTVEQGMVTYGSFSITEQGELTFFANDSIGIIVDLCSTTIEIPTETPTPTETVEATLTPTATVTEEITPAPQEPTLTPTQPGTEETATLTPVAGDPTPTNTQPPLQMTATPADTQTPVPTPGTLPITGGGPGPREVAWTGAALLAGLALLAAAWRRMWVWMRDG